MLRTWISPNIAHSTKSTATLPTIVQWQETSWKDWLGKATSTNILEATCINIPHLQPMTYPNNHIGAKKRQHRAITKGPEDDHVVTIHGDHKEARQCYNISMKFQNHSQQQVNNVDINNNNSALAELDPRVDFRERPSPSDDLQKVFFTEDPNKFTFVGKLVNGKELEAITTFLQQQTDLFAWTPSDMPGIDPHVINHKGIEANPEKCRAVMDMASPKTVKEVQRLTGRLAALSRFVPCLASKSIPFFQTTKMKNKFQWTEDCERAFTTLKTTLSQPPVLQKPLEGEDLFLYLSITDWAISSALVVERDKIQFPVYFISKTLQHTEINYPRIEKLALALVFSARRLRPYFHSHVINVRTDHPLRQVLHKPDIAGRLIKWSIELSEFDIRYQSKGPIKSQFLADFIAELTIPSEEDHTKQWRLYIDGSSNKEGCGAGIRLEADDGSILGHSLHLAFKASNNQSEYEALVAELRLCLDLHISTIEVYCDSLLVVQQVNDLFQVRDPLLSQYLLLVKDLISKFSKFEIQHIPREQNQRADILSKLGSFQSDLSTLHQSTITSPNVTLTNVLSVTQKKDWRDDFIKYLQTGDMPEGIENVKRFRRQATFFTLFNGALYRRGYTRPLLKCLNKADAEIALSEAHEEICGTHTGARNLASKILRAGFFWPTLKHDSKNKVQTCENCQKHASIIHIPAEDMHHSDVTWPFNQWGLDILGPFPPAPGQVKFIVVAIDYFSKLVEAQPLAKITSQQIISFIWKNIICRFGIPQHIITDNGRQFVDQKFQAFLQVLKIRQHFASVEHPQTNELAEAANKVILHALKKKLDDAKGLWAELIPEVIWGYNTTQQSSTKKTPFRLVYGSEAMIPL
nr:uncharacterized protein LOC112729932 [Arachis hypogaea]